MAIPGISAELQQRLADGMARVDALLQETVQHEDPFIMEASAHLLNAGGKRVRPLLTLLAAELGEGINDAVITAAAAVELTHLASLYHDDVMDDADVRRGTPSANAKYDNSTAILVGDLLFGKASELVADLGAEAVKIQARTFVRLCAGQIRDDRPHPGDGDPIEYYLGILADKTGVLIATAARYGAMFSGCDAATVELVREYGERVGMTFQLADDLIDVASDIDELGKEPGTDLREGKRTLPVLYALASTDPADARLQELVRSDLAGDDAAHAEALELLRMHPAMAAAKAKTDEVARSAQAALDQLPDGEVKHALAVLADLIVSRVG
ncbi:MAG TPA: polyprenyl synthetase family protein [Intrasporangiaceae bacterium]|nr:polyprenyl synthetase family protein [Intrasporangiaceae bacterium]